MNKCLIILFVGIFFSCTNSSKLDSLKEAETLNMGTHNDKADNTIKSLDGDELIDSFYQADYLDSLWAQSKKIEIESHQIHIEGEPYKIVATSLADWSDPGDYLRIEILNASNEPLLQLTNFEGWVRFNKNYQVPDSVQSLNKISSDKLLVVDLNSQTYLLLFGWVYASEPGFLTMVELSSQPQMIFNKLYEIKGFSDKNADSFIDLVGSDDFEEISYLDLHNKLMKK